MIWVSPRRQFVSHIRANNLINLISYQWHAAVDMGYRPCFLRLQNMADFTNSDSFCLHAPGEAQEAIKKHFHDLLNGSDKVAIHYDPNATTWSVQLIQHHVKSPVALPDDPLTAAKLDPREFEQYRIVMQMQIDCKLAMEDKRVALALDEKKLAQETELALAEKVTQRELALITQQQTKNHRPHCKSKPSRALELLVHDVPATKKRRIRECENVSKLVIDKISNDWRDGEWPCSLLTLYRIVHAEFKNLAKPSPSIYHEQVPHTAPPGDPAVPFFVVLWTVITVPRRGVVSRTLEALVRRMIGPVGLVSCF